MSTARIEGTTGLSGYTPPSVRLTATYQPAMIGQVLPGGQPETVEIEVFEPLPAGPTNFIAALVDTLFRAGPNSQFRVSGPTVSVPPGFVGTAGGRGVAA